MMAVGCGAALFSVSMVSMAAKSAAALAVGPFLAQRWPQTLTLGPVFNQPHGTLSAGTVGNGRLLCKVSNGHLVPQQLQAMLEWLTLLPRVF